MASSKIRPDALINTEDGRKYWEGVEADENGMLGGIPSLEHFGNISRTDIQGSRAFLAKLGIGVKAGRVVLRSAMEGGAGIGRITKGLLLNIAQEVDVVEPIERFTNSIKGEKGVRRIYNVGLEEWKPDVGVQYDLIWTQWCLGHLTDQQIVKYLETCKAVLRPESGIIVVKENLAGGTTDEFDAVDSAVTRYAVEHSSWASVPAFQISDVGLLTRYRLDKTFRDLFQQAGLRLVRTELQRNNPVTESTRLLPVRMFALKPL